jgi:hypothetical protein
MRKTLFFALIALTALSAVAGERYYNRASGQDIQLPKAPEPEKVDLFEKLKKDLEAKSGEPTFPALPVTKDAPTIPATPAAKKDDPPSPPMLPSLPMKKDDGVTAITPPMPPVGKDNAKPAGISGTVPDKKSADVTLPPMKNEPTFPPLDVKKSPALPSVTTDDKQTPKPASNSFPALPQQKKDTVAPPMPAPASDLFPPPDPPKVKEPAKLEPMPQDLTVPPQIQQTQAPMTTSTVPQAVALPKNSPWSLNVVMVDGQTIVTATVNKKHEFKILCQTLDLQTGKGTLKASGKVRISGDALNGTCEHVSIALLADRLLLEGKALVNIDRSAANSSDSFELKGETLNLRISELDSIARPDQRTVEAIRTSRADMPSRVVPASMKLEGTQWTPYGRLRAVKSSESMWSLESSNGTVIAYLLAREGGSLERYVGQSISVYGTREREREGQPVLRVTHIALP